MFPSRGSGSQREGLPAGAARADGGSTPAKETDVPSEPPRLGRPGGDLSLLSLLELSNELNVRMDLYEIADAALYNLLGHFGCSRGAFWVLPEDTGQDAVLVRSQGIPAPVARAVQFVGVSHGIVDSIGPQLPPAMSRWKLGRSGRNRPTISGLHPSNPIMMKRRFISAGSPQAAATARGTD